jgi:molybdate transport system substrate-binding protein
LEVWPAAAALCVLACLPAGMLSGCGDDDDNGGGRATTKPGATPLLCYVGGTMRPVMEKLAADYRKQTGTEVQIDSAGSGELLTRIVMQKRGDLYVCHDPFQLRLGRRGMSVQGWTLAAVTPTIVVPKGNPKQIKSVKDLARPGLKLAMTDATKSTTGWIIPTIFDKAGVRKEIEANIVTRTRGGGGAANLVGMGDKDAAIVWNAVAYLRQEKLDVVPIDPPYRPLGGIDAVTSPTGYTYEIANIKVTMDLLTCSKQPDAARKFAGFVLKNQAIFTGQFGFSPPPPQPKAGKLYIHCGAGLRYAMEDAVETFRKRTGTEFTVNYQGSGVLLTSIKLKELGDLYMPGDVAYLQQLEKDKLLVAQRRVAYLVPVIVVPKGNPKGIKSLSDLVKPSMRLGLGNPKSCQIGRLSERLFAKNKIDAAAVQQRITFSSGTVNEIGVKLQGSAIDAGIVWDAIAANFARHVDAVKIPPEQNLTSEVAIGLLAFSKSRPLAMKFMGFLASPEGKAIFTKHHYTVEEPK